MTSTHRFPVITVLKIFVEAILFALPYHLIYFS
jgi:hypothetical protein